MLSNLLDFGDAFSIGSYPIKWYAIFYLIAFVVCIVLVLIKLHFWKKVPVDPFFYFVFIGVPISIFGGRIWDIITGATVVSSFPQVFGFVNGTFVGISGLSIQGGVIFAVAAALLWFPFMLRRPKYMIRTPFGQVQQISMWVYADAIVPVVLLGQVVGRWGNFFNHELFGPVAAPGSLDWLKAFMPGVWEHMHIRIEPGTMGENGFFDTSLNPNNLRHPMFLYESFANFVGFMGIFVGLEFWKKLKAGTYCSFYFIWYGLVRISMEAFKEGYDTTPYFIVAGLFILVGVLLFVWGQWVNYRYCRNLKLFRMARMFTFFCLQHLWVLIVRFCGQSWGRFLTVLLRNPAKGKEMYIKFASKKPNGTPVSRVVLQDYYKRDLWYATR